MSHISIDILKYKYYFRSEFLEIILYLSKLYIWYRRYLITLSENSHWEYWSAKYLFVYYYTFSNKFSAYLSRIFVVRILAEMVYHFDQRALLIDDGYKWYTTRRTLFIYEGDKKLSTVDLTDIRYYTYTFKISSGMTYCSALPLPNPQVKKR